MNKTIFTALIVLVLSVPTAAFAQPTFANQTRYYPIFVDSECFFYGPPGCIDDSGLYYHDTQTGKLVKPLPFVGGVPVCHDPLYSAGVLGSTCHDEGDDPTSNNATDWVDPMPKIWVTPEPEPKPCTDGRTCPPCPEGVEAGWCQDEDERQDTDDELSEESEESEEGGVGTIDIPSLFKGEGNEGKDDGDQEVEVPELFGP